MTMMQHLMVMCTTCQQLCAFRLTSGGNKARGMQKDAEKPAQIRVSLLKTFLSRWTQYAWTHKSWRLACVSYEWYSCRMISVLTAWVRIAWSWLQITCRVFTFRSTRYSVPQHWLQGFRSMQLVSNEHKHLALQVRSKLLMLCIAM